MGEIRVAIIDDDVDVLVRMRRVLGRLGGMRRVGGAVTGREGIELCRDAAPDVVLLDMRLPDMSGAAVARLLSELPAPPAVVGFSSFGGEQVFHEALWAGVTGYLLKSSSPQLVAFAIRNAHERKATLSPDLVTRVLDSYRAPLVVEQPDLSARELELLRLIAQGLSNREIAERLTLSETTVKSYASRLLPKVGCQTRAQLVAYAYRAGLVH